MVSEIASAIKMKTPFSLDQFLAVFKNYNEAVFPMQIILFLLSVLIIYLTIKPKMKYDKTISGFLAFLWLWMGIIYHLIFFTSINIAAYVFGSFFILQGVLFLIAGVLQNKISYKFKSDLYGKIGITLILFSLIIYPVIGYLLDHLYPYSPTFGLPCPTTIFTFGILLLNTNRCPLYILIIPFLWSVIGFTAAFNFGIWEDTGLFVAGLLSTSLLLTRNRKLISIR
jgi:hypothetical protein